jgi:myo-inositol-1(or 4)-monophosphatase
MKQPDIRYLEKLAHTAGQILHAGYEQKHDISYKGEIDLVTEVDARSEEFLIAEIKRDFPSHHIHTEESGILDGDDDHVWYLDPLDGTVNYAHGIPIFSVSIAYAYAAEVRLGIVYDPMRGEMFSAVKSKGATLNGEPIQAANTSELARSLLTTGFPYDMWHTADDNLASYGRFAKLTQGVRRLGSAALDLCYVGCGRFDGFWERKLQPYDVAAGGLVATEAGAKVTRLDGSPDYLKSPPSILAANPHLHKKMLNVLDELDSSNKP